LIFGLAALEKQSGVCHPRRVVEGFSGDLMRSDRIDKQALVRMFSVSSFLCTLWNSADCSESECECVILATAREEGAGTKTGPGRGAGVSIVDT
jgi:hypothetical protein